MGAHASRFSGETLRSCRKGARTRLREWPTGSLSALPKVDEFTEAPPLCQPPLFRYKDDVISFVICELGTAGRH